MTSYHTVSRIIYGGYTNLDTLLKYLFEQFPFLTTYLNYHVDSMEPHVVHFCRRKLKSSESHDEEKEKGAKKVAKEKDDINQPPNYTKIDRTSETNVKPK